MPKLSTISIKPENPGFLDEDFMVVVETLIPTILRDASTTSRDVSPAQAAKHKGCFVGLLNEMGVNCALHPVAIRINGLNSSFDYDGVTTLIYVPSASLISRYHSAWKQSFSKQLAL